MKRQKMVRAALLGALLLVLLLALQLEAQALEPASRQSAAGWSNPFWSPQSYLQTNWWTTVSAYSPLFWVFYDWWKEIALAPLGQMDSGYQGLPPPSYLCGGEEGFVIADVARKR